jgi:membrane protein
MASKAGTLAFATGRFNWDRFAWVQEVRRSYAGRLTSTVVRDFIFDDCPTRASVIAYCTLLSLFPLLLVLLTIVGYLVADYSTKSELVIDVSSIFPGSGALIQQTIDAVQQKHSSATIFATLALFWSASGAFNAINRNVNAIWRVPKERGIVESYLLALFMVVVVFVVFLVSLGFTTLVQFLSQFPGLVATHQSLTSPIIALLVPVVVTSALFTLIYRFIPNLAVAWSFAIPGGITAGLLFEVGKQLFALYLTTFAQFDAVYGPIGAVIALLTWAYYSSIILLIGCEVSHSMATLAAEAASPPEQAPTAPLAPG